MRQLTAKEKKWKNLPMRDVDSTFEYLRSMREYLPTPLQDRVLVRRIAEDDSEKLIIAPDIAKQKPLKGEVLAVGPGKRRIDDSGEYFVPTQVKVGQKVLLSPSVNREWPDIIEGWGVIMIQEADILGVLEG